MSIVNKLVGKGKILVILKTKRDIGFWQYQLFGLLSLFMERANNYFIVTDNKIILYVNDKVKADFVYEDFSKIKINTKKDILSFISENNKKNEISLSEMNLQYEDYQILKNKFNSSL